MEQLSKEDMMRLDCDRMIESIKQGWNKDDMQHFWGWTDNRYAKIYALVYEEVKDDLKLEKPQNLDTEIMKVFETTSKQPKAHKWTDPRDGKVWNDVSEFWGL